MQLNCTDILISSPAGRLKKPQEDCTPYPHICRKLLRSFQSASLWKLQIHNRFASASLRKFWISDHLKHLIYVSAEASNLDQSPSALKLPLPTKIPDLDHAFHLQIYSSAEPVTNLLVELWNQASVAINSQTVG